MLRDLLCRVLVLWARRTPAVGYFQGLADLVEVLVACFLAEHPAVDGDAHRLTPAFLAHAPPAFLARVEADAFWCTTLLMNIMAVCPSPLSHCCCSRTDNGTHAPPQKSFTHNFLEGVEVMLEQTGNILAVADAPLWSALVQHDVQLSFFAFRWVVCLLVREFDIANTLLLWDAYVALGPCFPRFHLFVCAALVIHERPAIAAAELYQVVDHMQNMGAAAWDAAQLRALLRDAALLAERCPFPDDPSVRNRRGAPRASSTTSATSASASAAATAAASRAAAALARVPARVLGAVERTQLVDTLAKAMRTVIARLGTAGTPVTVAQAKRVVAYMVVLAAVCLATTGTVLALRRTHPDAPPDPFGGADTLHAAAGTAGTAGTAATATTTTTTTMH